MAPPRTSRTEQAYRHLTEELARGRWQAGDTLSTSAISQELKISRTPVMEALKRLEADGVVEIIPQVGCRIVRPASESADELFGVQGALEGLAAAAAARTMTEDDFAALEALVGRLEDAAAAGDRARYEDLAEAFHVRLTDLSGMPRVINAAQGVRAALRHQLARLPLDEDELRQSAPELRELYEALRQRMPTRARAAAERHAKLLATRYARRGQGAPDRLVHDALVYSGVEEFLATTTPFVEEGLAAGERMLAVTTAPNAEALARALGANADRVEFRDSNDWYILPSHTMLAYERYLENAGADRVRVIGEVAWDGESTAPMSEWTRYEAMINVAFALEPVSFICPYDAGRLPDAIVAEARRTHPHLRSGPGAVRSDEYMDPAALSRELDAEPLPEPAEKPAECRIEPDLRRAREFILRTARDAGVTGKALQDTFLAVQEAAANVLTLGPREGVVRAWRQDGELVFEVRDEGRTAGDLPQLVWDPTIMSDPRGLWMARLLCDLVEARSGPDGLVVRLHVAAS